MRLSNIQTLIFYFFLITFLTLFFNADAKAQTTLFASSYTNSNHHQNRFLSDTTDNYNYDITDTADPNARITGVQLSTAASFRFSSAAFQFKLPAYHVAINNMKGCPKRSIIPPRLYTINLKHSARLTFKLFKLVISPLW